MKSPTIEEITLTTIENMAPKMLDGMLTANAMNKLLYGDDRTYSRRELFVMRWQRRRDRARDAWLVLTGRAEIGDW